MTFLFPRDLSLNYMAGKYLLYPHTLITNVQFRGLVLVFWRSGSSDLWTAGQGKPRCLRVTGGEWWSCLCCLGRTAAWGGEGLMSFAWTDGCCQSCGCWIWNGALHIRKRWAAANRKTCRRKIGTETQALNIEGKSSEGKILSFFKSCEKHDGVSRQYVEWC